MVSFENGMYIALTIHVQRDTKLFLHNMAKMRMLLKVCFYMFKDDEINMNHSVMRNFICFKNGINSFKFHQ